jgi:hypothetical protein
MKDGALEAGPFHSGFDLVLALTTSWRCYEQLRSLGSKEGAQLFLTPWDPTIRTSHEFRAFVHRHRLTAVSQYDAYNCHGWHSQDEAIAVLVQRIQAEVAHVAAEGGLEVDSYCIDVHFDPQSNVVKVLELNSFGPQCAAGSCLFQWLRDFDRLHGAMPGVEVRVVCPDDAASNEQTGELQA